MSSKASEKSASTSIHHFKPTTIDVYFLAITISLGGQYNRWTDTLATGFWGTVVSMIFNGIGYVCFAACMAEMAGTLPFSGGVYGFVRAFVGPLSGYIVSRFEIMMVICYVALLGMSIGSLPTAAGISVKDYEPAWWLLFYGAAVGVASVGCNYVEYWAFIRLIGSFSLILLLIYILGSFASVDYDRYASADKYDFSVDYFGRINQCAGMFRGVHYLPLLSTKVADPKTDIPQGAFFSMLSLFITAFGVIFTTCTQYPGTKALVGSGLPLVPGFMKMFNLTVQQAIWLNFPALWGNFYGFVWAYGRQLSSMAKSGLLPEFVGWMLPVTDTPLVGLLIGTVLSFSLGLICFYQVAYYNFTNDVKFIYALSSYTVYAYLFISYIIFKLRYSSLARSYTSPFGITGAIVGLLVFIFNTIAVLYFTKDTSWVSLYTMLVATAVVSLYYFVVLHGKQQFSEEEKEKLFKAYLISANQKSRQAVKKKGSPVKAAITAGGKTAQTRAGRHGSTASGVMSHSSDNSSHIGSSSRDPNPAKVVQLNVSHSVRSSLEGDISSPTASPARPVRKNNQVIPEDDENQLGLVCSEKEKEDAVMEVETVKDSVIYGGASIETRLLGQQQREEAEEPAAEVEEEEDDKLPPGLLEELSDKYNLSQKLTHVAESVTTWVSDHTPWHHHNNNAVAPDHPVATSQQVPPQQHLQLTPQQDIELGAHPAK